jgi:hypothetical protein
MASSLAVGWRCTRCDAEAERWTSGKEAGLAGEVDSGADVVAGRSMCAVAAGWRCTGCDLGVVRSIWGAGVERAGGVASGRASSLAAGAGSVASISAAGWRWIERAPGAGRSTSGKLGNPLGLAGLGLVSSVVGWVGMEVTEALPPVSSMLGGVGEVDRSTSGEVAGLIVGRWMGADPASAGCDPDVAATWVAATWRCRLVAGRLAAGCFAAGPGSAD